MDTEVRMCEGVIFKGKVKAYINSRNEYVEERSLVPQRELSCLGCPDCIHLLSDLKAEVGIRDKVEIVGLGIEEGELYEIIVLDGGRLVYKKVQK